MAEATTPEWRSLTLGQNKKIQEIAATAAKASELLSANAEFAKAGLQAASVFLKGMLNPKIVLLNAVAEEIDNYVNDLKSTGYHILEVCPDGGYLIPKDADGNPFKLIMLSSIVAINMARAAAEGQIIEFGGWAKEVLLEDDIKYSGPQKERYYIEVGKSKSKNDLEPGDTNVNDDTFALHDKAFGLYKMTPSQTIVMMMGAMDDEFDDRRPQFSESAEVGAIAIIVGAADLTKNLATIQSTIGAFVDFFGGENGLMTEGFKKIDALIKAALGGLEDPTKHDVTLTVKEVCGVRGTEEDEEELEKMNVPYEFGKKGGKTPHIFRENDLVVGPRVAFLQRCVGYVSKVSKTEPEKITTLGKFGEKIITDSEIYTRQELVITALTDTDAHGFRSLASGAKLQKVVFKERTSTTIDQNSGEVTKKGPFNDFEYMPQLQLRTYRERFPGSTVTVPVYDPAVHATAEITSATLQLIHHYTDVSKTPTDVPYVNIFENDGQVREEWAGSEEYPLDTKILKINQQDAAGGVVVGSKDGTQALTQVKREPGKTLLTVLKKEDITEIHTPSSSALLSRLAAAYMGEGNWWERTTYNTVVGDILEEKTGESTVPDFKATKLEDLIGDFTTFFSSIDVLTKTLRDMAKDTNTRLDDMIKYLSEKIEELDKLEEDLQKVLKLFTVGLPSAGVYTLGIPPTIGGNEYIKSQLQSAPNKPPDSLEFTMGFLIVGGGPSIKVLQSLLTAST